jgi:hypothetical protein
MSQGDSPYAGDTTHTFDTGGPGHADSLVDDHLVTTRLPPLPRPPLPARVASAPPPLHSPVFAPAPGAAPGAGAILPPGTHPGPLPQGGPSAAATADSRSSWWRALLQSTRAAATQDVSPPSSVVQVRVAASSAALAVVTIPIAMVIGLRDAPSDILVPQTVSAAVVIARALVAVGLIAFSVALLQIAERLFATGKSGARRDESR